MKRKDRISEAVKGAIKNGQSLNPSVNRLRKVSIGIKKETKNLHHTTIIHINAGGTKLHERHYIYLECVGILIKLTNITFHSRTTNSVNEQY